MKQLCQTCLAQIFFLLTLREKLKTLNQIVAILERKLLRINAYALVAFFFFFVNYVFFTLA